MTRNGKPRRNRSGVWNGPRFFFFKYANGGPQGRASCNSTAGPNPDQLARLMPMSRARARGSLSNSEASCSVIAPASCSTSVIVTARS